LLVNLLNSAFDALRSCGLIAQVFLGTLYGVPGVDWLGVDAQEGIVVLGYLGLILLVYEGPSPSPRFPLRQSMVVCPSLVDQLHGTRSPFFYSNSTGGLTSSLPALFANVPLCLAVAVTGILAPIALSFLLIPLMDGTSLQAFAAGASLCSTSLGTTFAVLKASGLERR
jgi:hypothetical protein